MLKQALKPAAVRFAAAAFVAAVGFSVIANTSSAEAASGRTVTAMSDELVDIAEHGWRRGPRHCHWRWRGRWVWFCHRHW